MIDYEPFFSQAASVMQESAIRRMGAMGLRVSDLISFAPGFPAPEVFAWDEFREAAQKLLSGADGSVLQYGATRGYQPLVDALPDIVSSRGIRATADEMIVTTGSQQALDLTARIFINPGDTVLVELPTYTGAITAFRNAQGRLVGVEQDADGISLDDLERTFARERAAGHRIAFLYVVPNFQNPTGLLISRDKRRRLLEWSARRNVLILEDDPYGALHFEEVASADDTRPIKADDAEGRVVYMSSFSKTVAPGFRVAWIVSPPSVAAKLEVAKQAADLCTGGLDQRVIYEVWKDGAIQSRLGALRAHYDQKRKVMERALEREFGDLVNWPQPRGGFFLWAAFPDGVDTDALLARAVEHRVIYVAGSAFYVDGRHGPHARLAFSAPSPARIEEGVRRLAAAVREEIAATTASAASAASSDRNRSSSAAAPRG